MPTLGVRLFIHVDRPWTTLFEAERLRLSISETIAQHLLDTFNDDGSIKQIWIEDGLSTSRDGADAAHQYYEATAQLELDL